MISLKDDTINPSGVVPQIMLAIMVAAEVYSEYDTDLVVTSLNDGAHSTTSLHYAGAEVDLRTRDLPIQINPVDVAVSIRAALNVHYDVLFEGDHIHIEWQPRRPQP